MIINPKDIAIKYNVSIDERGKFRNVGLAA